MIFSFLVMGIYLLISMIPGVFYTDAFETIKPVGNLNISNGRYGLLVYYTFLSSLMTVVMGYFFQTMVKGVKGFMAISIAYLILMVLFGAVITYNYAELAIIHNGEAMIAEDYFHMIFEQAGILRSDVTGQMTDVEATFD